MKRYFITKLLAISGMLMAMQCLSCDSDSEDTIKPECIDGFRQCTDIDYVGHYRICENHHWSEYQVCPGNLMCDDDVSCQAYSPNNPQPAVECLAHAPSECDNGVLKYCEDNRWAYAPCVSGACRDEHSCAETCDDGEIRCFEPPDSPIGMLAKCQDTYWIEDEVCPSVSCSESRTSCGECMNGTYSTSTYGYVEYCHRGKLILMDCTSGFEYDPPLLCVGPCEHSGSSICWENKKRDDIYFGESYHCIEGEWVHTECSGPCNAEGTDCAEPAE